MEDYVFVRVCKENLHHLQTLYKHAFNIAVPVVFFEKKFNTHVFGAAWLGFLAMDKEQKPAAYYGVFPCLCDYFGKKILVAQSGDTMTHPGHRGKGLFIQLALKTYSLARESGVAFVFGFPNENSYPGFVKKLNWKHRDNLDLFKVDVKTVPLAKLAKKFSFLAGVYDRYCGLFLKSSLTGDTLENSVLHYNHGGILHDRNFFEYKRYNKSCVGVFSGKKVWFKIDGRLWIGDIEPCTKEEFRLVLRQVKQLAARLGCAGIYIHLDKSNDLYSCLLEEGRVVGQNPVGYLDFDSGLDFSRIKFVSADFDTF